MKIKYEPHPVSDERKAKLVADGFKIIDSKFAPRTGLKTWLAVVWERVNDIYTNLRNWATDRWL